MLKIIITFLSAISISVIAAGYSIMGLATLFAGAVIPIIAMGTVLEVGKLVAASWLYDNWNNKLVPASIRAYLTIAVIVLVFVTSMGIFGFLSKAHLDQVQPQSGNTIKIELIDNQISSQNKIIERSQKTLTLLDLTLEKYIDMEYVTRGLKEREKQKPEREALTLAINEASDKISELSDKKGALQLAQDRIEAEVGPIKYIAELIYGDEAQDHFDKAVRWVIITLIFVFDPLAVLLLIAANISMRTRRHEKEHIIAEEKADKEGELKKEISKTKKQNLSAKTRAGNLRREQKVYRDFFKKLGARSLTNRDYEDFFKKMGNKEIKALGLDPDEIRIKADQIMDWNDTSNKP
jgi:hypothetical protein